MASRWARQIASRTTGLGSKAQVRAIDFGGANTRSNPTIADPARPNSFERILVRSTSVGCLPVVSVISPNRAVTRCS